jgi:hypothetical protein
MSGRLIMDSFLTCGKKGLNVRRVKGNIIVLKQNTNRMSLVWFILVKKARKSKINRMQIVISTGGLVIELNAVDGCQIEWK